MKTLRILLFAVLAYLPLAHLSPASGAPPIILTTPTMEVDMSSGNPTLACLTAPDQTYFVEVSTDLKTWTYLNEIFYGDGNLISMPFDRFAAPRLFARFHYTSSPVPPGTSPGDCDFDGDGLTNQQELDAGCDPFNPDTDGDGLSDFVEVTQTHTSPTKTDTDGNGISDAYEDSDGDSLTNIYEVQHGLNPGNADTDGDGIPDGSDTTPLANNVMASPDTAGLIGTLADGLTNMWTFETVTPQNGSIPARYPNEYNSAGPADIKDVTVGEEGMFSRAANFTASTSCLKAPPQVFSGRTEFTVAFWFQFQQNYIQNKAGTTNTVFFAYNNENDAYPEFVLQAYKALNSASTQKLIVSHYSNGTAQPDIVTDIPLADPLDSGKWNHLAITKGSGTIKIYRNGTLVKTAGTAAGSYTPQSTGYFAIGRAHPAAVADTSFRGKIDRFSIYSRALTATEAAGLYHLDSDRDGLWDITENATAVWRDANSNGVRDTGETTYQSNPYIWQPPTTDTDGDGLTDIDEQTRGTQIGNPDTDGDLIPDGWEVAHGLNPLVADAALDPDGDGLTNLDEYRYNTDPHKADTDGDGVNDGTEVKGPDGNITTDDGSDPTDPTDHGIRLPADQLVTFKLGVGDRSGSHSEDYVLNVFRLDPASGAETRIYTLRSGGFGLYDEQMKSFRKGDTYTFQIAWQNSSNFVKTPIAGYPGIEGPDWDYHMVVEPQGTNTGGILIDSYDPETKSIDTSQPILDPQDVNPSDDDDDNVVDFPNTLQKRRVIYLSPKVVNLAPVLQDEDGNDIFGSNQPSEGAPLTPFTEANPYVDRIAHRELKVIVGAALQGRKVTWTLEPVPGATPANIRGDWEKSPNHKNRFETSATYGANGFRLISQASGETVVGADGTTAIRVNVPPVGLNQARIYIRIEGDSAPISLIDMEVPAVVVIDPGHGGDPSGPQIDHSDPDHAKCPSLPEGSGLTERGMTLDYGMLLRERLWKLRQEQQLNIKVYMTRDKDENLGLTARANVARTNGADILISLHFNDNVPNTGPRGTETYIRSTGNVNESEDRALANRVNTSVYSSISSFDTGARNRGVKSDALGVLSDGSLGNSSSYHPVRAVLLETEFIDVLQVDRLLNTNPNATMVKQDIIDDLGDALLDDLRSNPPQ